MSTASPVDLSARREHNYFNPEQTEEQTAATAKDRVIDSHPTDGVRLPRPLRGSRQVDPPLRKRWGSA